MAMRREVAWGGYDVMGEKEVAVEVERDRVLHTSGLRCCCDDAARMTA